MIGTERYTPFKVTIHLHPAFVAMLQQETERASLAQNQFTIIPSSLLQLATMILAEIK